MRSRLLRGGFWAVLSRIGGIGFGLAFNVLLARMLTPEEMGAYFLAISVIALAAGFGQLGLSQVVVRIVAESMSVGMLGRAKQTVQRAMSLSLVGGIVVALLFYFAAGDFIALHVLHSQGVHSVIGLISLAIVIVSLQGVVTETYRGFHDIRAASLVGSVLIPAVSVGFLALLWANQEHVNLHQVFILTVASSIVAFIVSGAFLRGRITNLKGSGGVAYQELISIGWPLCLIQIVIFVATQADLWIVGAFLSERDAAIYGSVQKLLMFMTMTHSLVVAVAQSSVAELYAKGEKQRLERIIQGMAFWACVPSGILFGAYALWGADILQLVFGEFYRDGYLPLLILAVGQFVSMLLGPADMLLMMTGFQKQLMVLIIMAGFLRVILAIALVQPLGIMGVAIGWSAGAIIQNLLIWRMGVKQAGIKCNANLLSIATILRPMQR